MLFINGFNGIALLVIINFSSVLAKSKICAGIEFLVVGFSSVQYDQAMSRQLCSAVNTTLLSSSTRPNSSCLQGLARPYTVLLNTSLVAWTDECLAGQCFYWQFIKDDPSSDKLVTQTNLQAKMSSRLVICEKGRIF